jgi:hypothetical protein
MGIERETEEPGRGAGLFLMDRCLNQADILKIIQGTKNHTGKERIGFKEPFKKQVIIHAYTISPFKIMRPFSCLDDRSQNTPTEDMTVK